LDQPAYDAPVFLVHYWKKAAIGEGLQLVQVQIPGFLGVFAD
jgi:hypothetical protein